MPERCATVCGAHKQDFTTRQLFRLSSQRPPGKHVVTFRARCESDRPLQLRTGRRPGAAEAESPSTRSLMMLRVVFLEASVLEPPHCIIGPVPFKLMKTQRLRLLGLFVRCRFASVELKYCSGKHKEEILR